MLSFQSLAEEQPQEPPLGVRAIAPGASIDSAGLDAMTPLIQSKFSKKHYLMPLPPGIIEDSAELFGFWTYELRVEHYLDPHTKEPVWSTAQARFGRPLRATGVQHPAPQLSCQAIRTVAPSGEKVILAAAPFATAVINGRVRFREVPASRQWVLMYTQVMQAPMA